MTYDTVDTFDFGIFDSLKEESPGRGRKKKKRYCHAVCAFDIETSNLPDIHQNIMYIWMFQIGDQKTLVGRTWDEFRTLVSEIQSRVKYNLVIWVHNLSYEFQYLKTVLDFEDVFSLDDRKILYAVSGKIEFRCSMLHSNMSLRKYLEKMEVPTQKKKLDYDVIRYPWTELTEEEMDYCVSDVKGLVEAVTKEMESDQDNLHTFPRTSTGYVRRRSKMSLQAYSRYVRQNIPDLETILMLQRAFRGGNTHGNRYYAMRIVEDAQSWDIASSYPSVMLTEEYPTGFEDADPETLPQYLNSKYCALMDLQLWNVKLKDPLWGCPYLAVAKCSRLSGYTDDNGRILDAKYLEMTVTEVDLAIIRSEYDFDFKCVKLKVSKKRRLPVAFRKLVWDMYEQKTELKGVDEYTYQKFKNMVNSLYGMTVQNPIKPVYWYNPQTRLMELDPLKTPEALLQRYQAHGWLLYQWGVYTTAYARLKLEKGLHTIPPERFLYCDTDSIKFFGEIPEGLNALNRSLLRDEYTAKDRKGKKHPIGIFEYEGHYKRFAHMGAKKYAYEDDKGKLHITIAGVNKEKGPKELGSLENFRPGFVFRESGGQQAFYNEQEDLPGDHLNIDGHTVELTTNVYLERSTYTLSVTEDYDWLVTWLSTHSVERDLLRRYAGDRRK